MDVISIESIDAIANAPTRAAIINADVIIGVDAPTGREFTVFGVPSLESSTSFKRPSAMRIVRVTIDCNSGDLEKLAALVRVLKACQAGAAQ